jgi:hypothetical protein
MIEERFLIGAINIRRVYIKLVSNLDFYKERAESTLKMLEAAEKDLDDVKKNINKKSDESPDDLVERIMNIFNDIENEGNKIEKFVEPLNKEIERLGIEERELYKRICDFHSTLSESQIVDIVQERLKKENLL